MVTLGCEEKLHKNSQPGAHIQKKNCFADAIFRATPAPEDNRGRISSFVTNAFLIEAVFSYSEILLKGEILTTWVSLNKIYLGAFLEAFSMHSVL